jgi:hypothetical protein
MSRYLPVEPLMPMLERRGGIHAALRPHMTSTEYDRVHKGLVTNRLTIGAADLAATRLGIHPSLIWGDLWYAGGLRRDQLDDKQKETAAA